MQAVRAPWTSASFLLYAGGITILLATGALLTVLGNDYGHAAFVGWSALAFVVLLDLAVGFRAARRPLAAGLFSVPAVVALAVLVGALEEWAGWLAHTSGPFASFHVSHFVIELTVVFGAVVARHIFRFPLLVLISAGAGWFFVTDLLSNGGNWSAVVTLFYGFVAMLAGLGADRIYGFWVQVVAGLTIGGALLTFWHSSDFDWIMIAIASVLYILLGSPGSEGRVTPSSARPGSSSLRRTSSSSGLSRSTSPSSARKGRAPSRGRPRSRTPSTGSC